MNLTNQLELEHGIRKQTQEIVQKQLQSLPADSAVSNGFTTHLLVQTIDNIRNSLESLKGKRGAKPVYYRIAMELKKHVDNFSELSASVTLRTVINSILTNGNLTTSYLALEIGHQLVSEIKYQKFIAGGADRKRRYEKGLGKRKELRYKEEFMKRAYANNDFIFISFSPKELQALGWFLVNIAVSGTDLLTTIKKPQETVQPTEVFERILQKNKDIIVSRAITYTPTIIPPKPWIDMYTGGYYGDMRQGVVFMRHSSYLQRTHRLKAYLARVNELDLSPIYQAVNKIQETPYHIRSDILSVIKALLTEDSGVCELPHVEPLPHLPRLPEGATKEELKAHKKKIVDQIHAEYSRRGKSLRLLLLIKLAEQFSVYDKIWFPHNIDFRGRIYPISIGLNPQGDDVIKSILGYAEPVPCTDEGDADIFLIAGAGLAGIDKVSYEESKKWVLDHEEQILESAKNPLEYRWWTEQDEPFQFLHFCLEYKRYKEYITINGSILGFETDLKIPFDGTCSGLQHYSCILRDEIGGSSVNLVDHERPADIYQEVADKIYPWVEKDSKGTDENIRSYATAWLVQGLTRKVVKRCVMTLAYGSAQYGFGDQLREDWTNNNPIFKDIEFKAAQYLAKYIYKAVGSIVVKAMDGMQYLKYLAGVMSDAGYAIEWITPLGLPIQQIYLKIDLETVHLCMAGVRYRLYVISPDEKERLFTRKQVSAVAPNFIHSMDATHLMLVVNSSHLRNYTTIHDSFGTSLGEAASLQKTLREQLVLLYTQHDVLQEFREHVEKITGITCKEPPEKGLLSIESVLKSRFVFH